MPNENEKDYDPTAYKPKQAQVIKPKTGFLKIIFIILGVIFTIIVLMIIGAVVALLIVKPYGIDISKIPAALIQSDDRPSSYDHPLLSTEQEKILDSLGVDVSSLPTEISAAQKECAIEALGAERVNQIVSGSTPTATEFFKVEHCF